jgi:hypothetical protein
MRHYIRTIVSYPRGQFLIIAQNGHLNFPLVRHPTAPRTILNQFLPFTSSAFPSSRLGKDVVDYGHPRQISTELLQRRYKVVWESLKDDLGWVENLV